jgi:predicted nucleotidyltransferase
MAESIKEYFPEIQSLCEKHWVKKLWLFGSAARDELDPDSDVDFLYQLNHEELSPAESNNHFFTLIDELGELLGRKIDFIWANGIKNPYFKKFVDQEKQLL